MKNPQTQASAQNALKKRQQLEQAKEFGFLLGVQCGAKVAKNLTTSGWTDAEKLEAEVLARVRGRRGPKSSRL